MASSVTAPAPPCDAIMAPAEMKPLLALSKREPVHAAVGITGDGEGIILLDKRMRPKKVLARLKAEAAKAKIPLQPSTLRFGKAEVDTDYDAGMVRFFLNKEAPGNMRIKLLAVVKRVPYQKVELNVDPSFEEEPEDEGEATEAGGTPAAPPPPALDARALTTALTQLVQAIPKVAGGDAALQKSLVALAAAAERSLKANDLAQAAKGNDLLRHALAAALERTKHKAGTPPVDWPAIRQTWQAASDAADQQIAALQVALRNSGDETLEEIAEFGVNGVTGNHKVRLMAAMLELGSGDPAVVAKLGRATLGLVRDFRAHLASDERVRACDENPFGVAVSLRATLGPALEQMERALSG